MQNGPEVVSAEGDPQLGWTDKAVPLVSQNWADTQGEWSLASRVYFSRPCLTRPTTVGQLNDGF